MPNSLEKNLIKSKIEKWIDADLARSGLDRNDISVVTFLPERKKNGELKNHGGYKIYYPDPLSGDAMKSANGRIFARKRFMPPLPDGRDGRRKYETAYGAGNHCFILPAVHRYLNENPSFPMYMTEGEKKAVKATKEGQPMLGLTGIWGWLESKSVRNKEGEDYAIHADILQYLKEPRDVYLIYDSDAKDTPEKTKSFDSNAERLAFELGALNCKLFRIDLPPDPDGNKQGVDDYLLKHSVNELKECIKSNAVEVSLKELSKHKDPYQEITKKEGAPYHIKYAHDGSISSVTFNQNWNARFLMKNHKIVYEPVEKEYYLYDEKCGLWEWIPVSHLRFSLSQELADYWNKFHPSKVYGLLPYRNNGVLSATISVLEDHAGKMGTFQKKPGEYIIHLANGMLHLDKMQLRNFAPEYYSRNLISYELDENAECPRFLNELMYPALPEDDVDLLQRWAGSVLLGGNPTQQVMLIEGTAGGGKGTFAEVLETVIGHRNVAELRTNLLGERFELAAFVGKSLLCGKDVPGNFLQIRGADAIKKLVGHDYLEAEHKRSNKRSGLYGDFAMMITSNSRLKVKFDGDANAWGRRLMLVRYERPPVEKRIVHFARKLIDAEAKGILLWMITGAVKTINEINKHGKIILNARQQRLVDSLLYESDSIGMFVKECLETCPGWDVTTEELKTAYVRFCEENGWSVQAGRNVERMIPDLILSEYGRPKSNSLKREGKSARGFRGLRIKGSIYT